MIQRGSGFDDIVWDTIVEPMPRSRRRIRVRLSHIGPAVLIAASIAMWAAAAVWLLVRMAS